MHTLSSMLMPHLETSADQRKQYATGRTINCCCLLQNMGIKDQANKLYDNHLDKKPVIRKVAQRRCDHSFENLLILIERCCTQALPKTGRCCAAHTPALR